MAVPFENSSGPGARRRTLLGGLLAAPAFLTQARAQDGSDYPDRPVRFVVPNPPGGASDILTRLLARELQSKLGQPFTVENRSGSNGIIGLDNVATSRPAGYSLIVATVSQLVCNPFVYRSIPYDLDRDFTPVGLVWEYYNLAAAPTALVPARNMPDFIAWARAQRDPIAYGSNGIATSPHLLGALFMDNNKVEGIHVPFRGAAETVQSLLRGDVRFTITDVASLLGYVRRGDLAPLAVTGGSRWPALPEVPTMAEVGQPQLEATVWTGVLASAGMPPAAVNKLSGAMHEILSEPAFQERVRTAGANPLLPDPDTLRQKIRDERPRWGRMVQLAGARLD
jgi:tripartite-type tricarboxylate transporter receptor subunit TctC